MSLFTVVSELQGALECLEELVKGASGCLGISDSDLRVWGWPGTHGQNGAVF